MRLIHTDEYMKKLLAEKSVSSYVVIVGKGGERQVLTSPDCDTDTYFDVASMGKVLITSTLILHAVSERKCRLTDTLSMYFPNVPEDKKNITVRQLLTHSSGIIRIPLTAEIAACRNDTIAAHIFSVPLAFVPDTKCIYSCNGYILLGFILEKIYGQTLDEIFYHQLKAPLGLTRSRFNIALDEENAAVCYRWKGTPPRRMDDENVILMRNGVAGSGGSFWSAADMEKFILAVKNYSPILYSRELFDMAERDYTPYFADEGRGLGYLLVERDYRQTGKLFPKGSFGHCGHTGTSFFLNRDQDLYVILLTNATRSAMVKNDFRGYNYNDVKQIREDVHNVILSDMESF